MTQEEKAKAYDEALERAKDGLTDKRFCETEDTIRSVVEYIFPQLTESDDERIREEMVRYFTEMKKGGSAALPYDDCIAYLERQKEQKPADEAEKFFDSVESYNQGFVAGQKKMKEDIEKGFGISEHSLDYLAGRYAGYAAARQEQEPAKWSEEDEDMRDTIIRDLKFLGGDMVNISPAYKEEVDWLKSLRPSWKPSEEQMSMLLAVINDPNNAGAESCQLALRDLYQDLKKLI